jgi:DUF1365 family protein
MRGLAVTSSPQHEADGPGPAGKAFPLVLPPPPSPAIVAPSRVVVPAIFRCQLTHSRRQGVPHRFRYTVCLWLVDVDDLPRLPRPLTPLIRFDPRDHLGIPGRPLRANLDDYLAANGIALEGGRILMLAQPRGLGYAFDPVTFFYCYRADESPACVIAEVRNTFGERHCYVIRLDQTADTEVSKALYVSPFFPLDGHYRMRFTLSPHELTAAVTLYRSSTSRGPAEPALAGVLTGHRVRAPASLAASLVRPWRVLSAYRTIALIHWQARRLRWRGLTPSRRRYHEPQPGVDIPAGAASPRSERTGEHP